MSVGIWKRIVKANGSCFNYIYKNYNLYIFLLSTNKNDFENKNFMW